MITKRQVVIILTAIFILTAVPITTFANSDFYDINEVPWAKEFIRNMLQENVISGYVEDSSLRLVFKPKDSVTKVQAIQMVYNTLKASNRLESNAGLNNKYMISMQGNNIPSWAYEAVAYGLEYGIISSQELPGMMNNGKQVAAKREDVAVYIGKALNLNQIILSPHLQFADAELINSNAKMYVQLLVERGILSGDNKNMFNPRNTITRAEMAAVCSRTLTYSRQSNVQQPNIPSVPVQNSNDKVIKRVIDFIATDTRTMIVKDDKNKLDVYRLASNLPIEVGGVNRDITYLNKDLEVELVFNSLNELIKVKVNTDSNDFEGTITNVYPDGNFINMVVRDKLDSSNSRLFQVLKSKEINASGGFLRADQLEKGQYVKIKLKDSSIDKIEVVLKESRVDGILDSAIIFKETPIIKVRVDNNRVIELEIDSRVDVYKNNRYRDLKDLVKGDIVQLKVKDSKVTRIDALSAKTKDSGVVKSVLIERPTKLSILNNDQEVVVYNVADNVDVYIDNRRATVFDLRVDFKVDLELESNQIISIEAKGVQSSNERTGEITRIHTNFKVVVIRFMNSETGRNESLSVTVTDNTKIFSGTGTAITLSRLYEKDKVFIDGYYEGELFIARRIIVLN